VTGSEAKAALESEALARRIVEMVDAKGATDVVALDVRGLVTYTDFLVICTARNERQAKAVHAEVHVRLKKEEGLLPGSVEGEREAQWVLVDYLDCVLHIFVPATRDYYRLETLWGEAPRLDLDLDLAGEASRGAVRSAP
jgi:ribosome-associated protein